MNKLVTVIALTLALGFSGVAVAKTGSATGTSGHTAATAPATAATLGHGSVRK